jgi:hypothetical protein
MKLSSLDSQVDNVLPFLLPLVHLDFCGVPFQQDERGW